LKTSQRTATDSLPLSSKRSIYYGFFTGERTIYICPNFYKNRLVPIYRQATVLGPNYEKAHSSLLATLVERASQINGVEEFKHVDPEVLTFRALQLSEQGDEAGFKNL
jgi:hypothetical protein